MLRQKTKTFLAQWESFLVEYYKKWNLFVILALFELIWKMRRDANSSNNIADILRKSRKNDREMMQWERERERVMCCQNTKNKIIIIK